MNIETPIDCLPPEMICVIMKNLNLNDLIQCKLVSKRWYSIVNESIKMIKLIVRTDEKIKRKNLNEYLIDVHYSRWFYSNELVNSDLHICELNLFQLNLKRKILSNLKYLKINEIPKFDFNQLNLLTQLIHLEINCYLGEVHIKLNLLELEILKIFFNSSCHLTIEECPKLKILYYDYEEDENFRLIMKYPESIKDLEAPFYGSELTQFKNVEYLKCGWNFDQINENTLSKLKKLKVIYFDVSFKDFFHLVVESGEQIELILRNYLQMIKKSRIFDLKLYCFGLQITDVNIDQIYSLLDSTNFYALNYKYLQDSLPFIDEVNYTRLVNLINPIPTDYFKKFYAITLVSADGEIDQIHFLWFLKNLKNLNQLLLRSTNLNQSFYDELPTICSLIRFELDEENKGLDFNFLIQFNKLINLSIILEPELSLKSIKSFIYKFELLNNLNALKFRFKEKKFKIERCSDDFNCYHIFLYHGDDAEKFEINLNEVISYFEKLK